MVDSKIESMAHLKTESMAHLKTDSLVDSKTEMMAVKLAVTMDAEMVGKWVDPMGYKMVALRDDLLAAPKAGPMAVWMAVWTAATMVGLKE